MTTTFAATFPTLARREMPSVEDAYLLLRNGAGRLRDPDARARSARMHPPPASAAGRSLAISRMQLRPERSSPPPGRRRHRSGSARERPPPQGASAQRISEGNTEGTPARPATGTRGHSSPGDSSFLRGSRARGFPAVPALPASSLDGKEGVDGSSPSEGFTRGQKWPLCCLDAIQRFLEPPATCPQDLSPASSRSQHRGSRGGRCGGRRWHCRSRGQHRNWDEPAGEVVAG